MNRKLRNNELGRLEVIDFKQKTKTPFIVVLDNIRSLNNIGSVFRTCDAFLVEAVYLCGICACPPHKDIQKTALGATESVEWQYFEETIDAIRHIKSKSYKILSFEQTENNVPLDKFSPDKDTGYAIVFGNEVKGVQQEVINESDYTIEIPQYGTKHSFNISVSVGIALWDLFTKYQKACKYV